MVRTGFFSASGDEGETSLDTNADARQTALNMSQREIEAMELQQRSIASQLENDPVARQRTAAMLKAGNLPPAMMESLQASLGYLSPSARADIMQQAGLTEGMAAVDAELTGGVDKDVAGESADARPRTGKSKKWVKEEDRKKDNFAAQQHPMLRAGTYGKVEGTKSDLNQIIRNSFDMRDASRYDKYLDGYGNLRADAPSWVERQILSDASPSLAAARDQHQLPRLQELVLTPDNVGVLTDQQIASIAGVPVEMVNPMVRQAVLGRRLTDDQIGLLRYSQRSALVGDPQVSSEAYTESSAVGDRQRATGARKLEYLLGRATEGNPQDFADLNEWMPSAFVQTGNYDPGRMSIVYPNAANSGDLLANFIRTATGYNDPQLVSTTGDYLSKVMRLQASRGRGEGLALKYANARAIPGARGEFYMRKYADDMPVQQYLDDVQVNREATAQPLNIGSDISVERPQGVPLDLSPLIDDAATMPPISNQEADAMPMPEDGDLSMADPRLGGRLNQSFLASLLA